MRSYLPVITPASGWRASSLSVFADPERDRANASERDCIGADDNLDADHYDDKPDDDKPGDDTAADRRSRRWAWLTDAAIY